MCLAAAVKLLVQQFREDAKEDAQSLHLREMRRKENLLEEM